MTVDHHVKYIELHGVDETIEMTQSEHKLLHFRLRQEGKCNVPPDELRRISMAAHKRGSKAKAYDKAYRAEHREQIKAYDKAYDAEHKDQIAARKKVYNATHRDQINARVRARYAARKLEAMKDEPE